MILKYFITKKDTHIVGVVKSTNTTKLKDKVGAKKRLLIFVKRGKNFPQKNIVCISLSKMIAVVLGCMVCPCPVNPVLANSFHLELDAG